MDVWKEIEAERRELGDLLEGLSDDQWETQTLCEAWKVRHLVAHLSPSNIKIGALVLGLPASGFNLNRFLSKGAIRAGSGDTEEILKRFQNDVTSRKTPPGVKPPSVLSDVLLHHQDIRRPLGMPRDVPVDRLTLVADYMKAIGFPLGVKKRIAGLRLAASDADWSHGGGPEVTGTLEALTMAMTGRRAAVDDLGGEGVSTLSARL